MENEKKKNKKSIKTKLKTKKKSYKKGKPLDEGCQNEVIKNQADTVDNYACDFF